MSDTETRSPTSTSPTDPRTVDERDGYTMNSYRDFAATGFGGDTDAKGPSRFLGPLALIGLLVLLGYFGGVTMVIIVLALILSIVLHELGHFLTARWAGMKATEFFIGFGPRIWSTRRGETEYGIKVIPAGAYVRIIGMHNLEEVDPADEDRTYRSKPYHKRLAVILAGPLANILLAFVLLVVVFSAFGMTDETAWKVKEVTPGSAAETAGIAPGDKVIAIGNEPLREFSDLREIINSKAGQNADITVVRAGGATETIRHTPLGWRLNAAGAAAIPGMQTGDAILDPDDDTRVSPGSYQDFARMLSEGSGPVTFRFQRGYYVYSNTVERPIQLPDKGASGFFGVRSNSDELPMVRESPPAAVAHAGSAMAMAVGQSGQALGRLFSPSGLSNYANTVVENAPGATKQEPQIKELHPVAGAPANAPRAGGVSASQQDRPISIIGAVRATNDTAKFSVAAAIAVFAMINLSLGLLNLLPMLPLDGGHAAVATYEAIRSRKGRPYRVNMAKLMPITYAFLAFLLVFGLSAMFLDIRAPITP